MTRYATIAAITVGATVYVVFSLAGGVLASIPV